MGLAVLPSRLKSEMAALEKAILTGADITADETVAKHAAWLEAFRNRYEFTPETHRKSCTAKSERPSCACWKMPVCTNAQRKAAGHSAVFSPLSIGNKLMRI